MGNGVPGSRHSSDDGGAPAALGILSAISLCHGLNDLLQSVLPAVYPILKDTYMLDFGQIGLITFTNTVTASLLQPVVGLITDKRPKPYSLAIGMGFTLSGCCCCRRRRGMRPFSSRSASSASARRSSIPSRLAWRASPRAAGTASRSRCFRSAATPARRPVRCWQPSSSCPTASAASRGSAWWRSPG